VAFVTVQPQGLHLIQMFLHIITDERNIPRLSASTMRDCYDFYEFQSRFFIDLSIGLLL